MLGHVWRLVALWAVTFATIALAETLDCQTTDGSPSSSDCSALINDLKNNPDDVDGGVPDCVPTNSKGSGCKDVFWRGSCKIVLCRKDGSLDLTLNKNTVLTGAKVLLDRCNSGGKVGGILGYDSMGDQNKGTSCKPKSSDSEDGSINIEFTKRDT